MIDYKKDDFDGSLEDIMKSVNEILNGTGEGYETLEEEGEEKCENKKKQI